MTLQGKLRAGPGSVLLSVTFTSFIWLFIFLLVWVGRGALRKKNHVPTYGLPSINQETGCVALMIFQADGSWRSVLKGVQAKKRLIVPGVGYFTCFKLGEILCQNAFVYK